MVGEGSEEATFGHRLHRVRIPCAKVLRPPDAEGLWPARSWVFSFRPQAALGCLCVEKGVSETALGAKW